MKIVNFLAISLRPSSLILAITPNEKVAKALALKWGVYSKVAEEGKDTDSIIEEGLTAAKEMFNLEKGDLVAVVGGFPDDAHTNFMKIVEL